MQIRPLIIIMMLGDTNIFKVYVILFKWKTNK